jgi:hypothetical protein
VSRPDLLAMTDEALRLQLADGQKARRTIFQQRERGLVQLSEMEATVNGFTAALTFIDWANEQVAGELAERRARQSQEARV